MQNSHASPARALALSHLRVFEAAGRLQSFTLAAHERALSQSAVSRHVADIERQLGTALFVRRTRALELTFAGVELLSTVQHALAQLDHCAERIRAASARVRIDISTFASFASMWLVPRLSDFQARHPEVDIRISASDHYVDLAREGFSVALRACDQRFPPANAVYLFDETVTPMCSPLLLRASERPLRELADLAHYVLLDLQYSRPVPALIDRWDKWFRQTGQAPVQPRGRLIFDMVDQMHQAAVAGQGVALGRSPFADAMLARGELVVPFGAPVATGYAYFLVSAPGVSSPGQQAAIDAFVDWVRETANAAQAQSLASSIS